jgi:hypothetical protein
MRRRIRQQNLPVGGHREDGRWTGLHQEFQLFFGLTAPGRLSLDSLEVLPLLTPAPFEVTPIEHWLELEIGVTATRTDDGVEMPVDVLFKKPWRLSREVEFMIGVGPQLVHASGLNAGTFLGLEGVLDLMFWRRKNAGWYVEPGYEMTFRDGRQHGGFSFAVGLLIGR